MKHFDQQGHLMPDLSKSSGVVAEVIDERVKVYGDPTVTFPQIAQVWSGYLGHEIKPEDVPMMMILMKSVRARQAPDYSDNTDDIEGYLDIYRKLVPGMIHARSVDEYIEKKATARRDAEHAANMYLDIVGARESNIVAPPVSEVRGHERKLYTSAGCVCGRSFGTVQHLEYHIELENS